MAYTYPSDYTEVAVERYAGEDNEEYGGFLDMLARMFSFDKDLNEAKRAKKQAKVQKSEARERQKEARARRRTAQEQTKTIKSEASRERITANQQARAESQRVQQERARKLKEAQRLAQMRVATKQEIAQRKTAREGERRDTAESRREISRVAQSHLLEQTKQDPSRVQMRAAAPIQAAASLNPPTEQVQGSRSLLESLVAPMRNVEECLYGPVLYGAGNRYPNGDEAPLPPPRRVGAEVYGA
jgi:hypothetical protein